MLTSWDRILRIPSHFIYKLYNFLLIEVDFTKPKHIKTDANMAQDACLQTLSQSSHQAEKTYEPTGCFKITVENTHTGRRQIHGRLGHHCLLFIAFEIKMAGNLTKLAITYFNSTM